MSKRSVRHQLKCAIPLLKALSRMDDASRISTLDHLTDHALQVIYQCIENCIYNADLPKKLRKKIKTTLSTHKNIYEYLSQAGKSTKRKKTLLKQIGGGELPLILTSTIPQLEAVLGISPT